MGKLDIQDFVKPGGGGGLVNSKFDVYQCFESSYSKAYCDLFRVCPCDAMNFLKPQLTNLSIVT